MPHVLLHRNGKLGFQQPGCFSLRAWIEEGAILCQSDDLQPLSRLVEGQTQAPRLAVASLFDLPCQQDLGARLDTDEKGQVIEVGLVPGQDNVSQWAVINLIQNLSCPTPSLVDKLG